MGYTRHALTGVTWNSLLKIILAVVAIFKIYMLSRLLSQSDLGLFTLTVGVLGITEALTETGINTIIIQSKRPLTYFIDTAWVIAIIRGLLISIVMLVASFFMKNVYGEEKLLLLIALASFVPFIKGFINPAIVSFQRDLRFFEDTVYRFSLEFVNTALTVAIALFFQSPYVLVIGMILTAIWEVLISFIFLSERPKFSYFPSRAQEILHHSKGLNASAVLGYSVQNIDNFLIGKALGVDALGVYANGYSLSHRVTLDFAKSVQHGTFPVFVKFSSELARLRRAFLKTLVLTVTVLFLVCIPFFLFPSLVVNTLLSEKWAPVIPILSLLLLAGIAHSVVGVSATLLVVRKKYLWMNLNLLATCILLIVLIPPLTQGYGLYGGALAVLLSRVLALPLLGIGIFQALFGKQETLSTRSLL